jgi:hypothetical protein
MPKSGRNKNAFDIEDVCDQLSYEVGVQNILYFSDTAVADAREVEQKLGKKLKLTEKDGNRSVLAGVPESYPP